jgi:hypothetical protein
MNSSSAARIRRAKICFAPFQEQRYFLRHSGLVGMIHVTGGVHRYDLRNRSTCSEQKFTDPVRFTKPESPTQLYFHRSLCTGRWASCFGRDRVACRILSAGFPVGGSSDRLLSNSSASSDAGNDLLASFLQRSWMSVQQSILPRRNALASCF